jgi:hypothetical protein
MVRLSLLAPVICLGMLRWRSILRTSPVLPHLSLRRCRYSSAARSRPDWMPSFSPARALNSRTLPSSDAETTKRASYVKAQAKMRCMRARWYTSRDCEPALTVQRRSVRSYEPDTSSWPVGE